MNSSLRLALIVNTFALMAGSGSGKTRTETAPAQTLSIHLDDRAHAPAQTLHSATDQASYLFRAARIRISWERPSHESPEDQGTDLTSEAFQQLDTRGYLVVRLTTRTPANVFPGALGYALPFAHRGAHVLIFYDRVETLAHSLNRPIYIIFGHAMAHEIGHVLLGSSEHTSGGLMQARWTPETWRLASSGLLAFTREEAIRMDIGLRSFQIRHVLPVQQSTFARSSAEDGKTIVKVYVLRNVSDRNLNVSWAQNIASQIFGEADVHIQWQLGEPRRGEQDIPITINISRDTPKTLAPGALACAQVYEGVHISVFWDRVQNTVSGASPAGTFLLAHVMAHEIAHVLERINRHSETGLMKASWTKSEIEGMCVRRLSLAPEDVQLIRQGLLKRVTQQTTLVSSPLARFPE